MKECICKIQKIKIGHYTDKKGKTGCTIILTEEGSVCGVDVRGCAPGTRETDLLSPLKTIDKVHGVLLSGGSAFGLDAASGVMKYLQEKDKGFDTGFAKVPIVPAAVIYDLNVGSPYIRPDKNSGYEACKNSETNKEVRGKIGAGTGATVGKILGPNYCMDSGLGSYSVELSNGIIMGAIFVVNAIGDVIDYKKNKIIAGAKNPEGKGFLNSTEHLMNFSAKESFPGTNTTIGAVVTNAKISKIDANKIASMAHNGLAKTVSPVHTSFDGDTIFVLSTGEINHGYSLDSLGMTAVEVVSESILNAIEELNP